MFEGSMERKGARAGGSMKAVRQPPKKMAATAALVAALAPALALAAKEYNLQPAVTPIAEQMSDNHAYIMWICVLIFISVSESNLCSINMSTKENLQWTTHDY